MKVIHKEEKTMKFQSGDKVYIISGKGVDDYSYGWNEFTMGQYVGEIITLLTRHPDPWRGSYGWTSLECGGVVFDERYLIPVNDVNLEIDQSDFENRLSEFFL